MFCPDPMLAFVEVLAVPVVMPKQTKMTSKSTAFKSGGTPGGMNRSKELALKNASKGGCPNPWFVDGGAREVRR